MAAHLKKRAMAEYASSNVETVPTASSETPSKKLKLVWKSPALHLREQRPPPLSLLEPLASSAPLPPPHDVMQVISDFSTLVPIHPASQAPACITALLDIYNKELRDATIRVRILLLLNELTLSPSCGNPDLVKHLVESLIKCLSQEDSHKVRSQLIITLGAVSKNLAHKDVPLFTSIFLAIKASLKDTNHFVRRAGVETLGQLCPREAKGTVAVAINPTQVQHLLIDYTHDSDARVRTGAFMSLLTMHRRGLPLERTLYHPVCLALNDENQGVRMVAAELVWVLCQLFPETAVTCPDSKEELRLVDDGFGKLCSLVSDLSMNVRAKAAGLLGSLHLVSQRFLDQTLDKKLMSNMRKKASLHERNKQMYASGEWASGNKWASDAPKDLIAAETLSVISLGACGAFVHGLEDEFLEVRSAALDSICELASNSARYATLSMDFLVDMLNDEIEGIRLNAIFSLRKISRHIVFRDDQLETVLSIVDDANREVREGVHELLSAGSIATKNGLMTAVLRLLRNLCKYPADRESIWKCFHHLGENHPTLVLALVNELLSTHAYFDTPEPNMDDPAYISVLILVFNAASKTPTILPHFPDHTVGHYSFIRALIPDIVPHLAALSPRSHSAESLSPKTCQELCAFMRSTLDKFEQVSSLGCPKRRHALVEMLIRDLERVAAVDAIRSARAQCIAQFHRVQMEMEQAQMSGSVSTIAGAKKDAASMQADSDQASVVDDAVKITAHLDKKFLGLGTKDKVVIQCLHLRAKSLQMIAAGSQTDNKLQAFRLCEQYVRQLEKLRAYIDNADVGQDVVDASTQQILDAFSTNQLDPNNPSALVKFLQPLIVVGNAASLLKLDPKNNLRAAKAVITEPGPGAADTALRFAAGMGTAVHVHALVENVTDIHAVRIRVRYPDLQTQTTCPNVVTDFKKKGPLKYRMTSRVVLSHGQWSEPCPVEISVVLCPVDKESTSIGDSSPKHNVASTETIQLSKPVNVLLSPKSSILF